MKLTCICCSSFNSHIASCILSIFMTAVCQLHHFKYFPNLNYFIWLGNFHLVFSSWSFIVPQDCIRSKLIFITYVCSFMVLGSVRAVSSKTDFTVFLCFSLVSWMSSFHLSYNCENCQKVINNRHLEVITEQAVVLIVYTKKVSSYQLYCINYYWVLGLSCIWIK